MNLKLSSVFIGILALIFITSCSNDEPNGDESGTDRKTNKWIYSLMTDNYLWDVTTNSITNESPKDFFGTLLNSSDQYEKDGVKYTFSTITQIGGGSASPSYDPGFEYGINRYGDGKVYFVVYYTKNNSSASQYLRRGYLITRVNGMAPTSIENAQSIMRQAYSEGKDMTLTIMIPGGANILNVKITPQAVSPSDNDAVYAVKDTTFNGKHLGYILYNNFDASSNSKLLNSLQDLDNKNIDYLVIDLRYNIGGSVSTSNLLGSALIKERNATDDFIIYIRKGLTISTVKLINTSDNINVPKLGDKLKKLYIITGKATAGTSDIFINALKAYWTTDMVIVGEKTFGYSNIALSQPTVMNGWMLQMATAYIGDKDRNYNYSGGFMPSILISEVNDNNTSTLLGDFGSKNEVVFARILSDLGANINLRNKMTHYDANSQTASSLTEKSSFGKSVSDIVLH